MHPTAKVAEEVNRKCVKVLANRIACSMIGYWHVNIFCLSVCLSVPLSVKKTGML